MSKKNAINLQSFDNLINDISLIFTQGLITAQEAVQYQRLKTYWHVGGRIAQYLKSPQNQFTTIDACYEEIRPILKKKINIDVKTDTLRRIVRFRSNYPKLPQKTSLTFTHYKALQRISDPKKRKEIERQAIKENMTFADLDLIAKQINFKKPPKKISSKKRTLLFNRGEPYIYCIRKNDDITDYSEYYIDLGFHFTEPIPDSYTSQLKAGHLIHSIKNDNRAYTIARITSRPDILYTYAARVANIVDGDTIDAHINVGFEHQLLKERLRFRGINTPELSDPEGKGIAAKVFLEKFLSKCPIIVIRTTKNNAEASAYAKGMFGRWLVDIFARPGIKDPSIIARKGIYLNQLLIDKGFAEPY